LSDVVLCVAINVLSLTLKTVVGKQGYIFLPQRHTVTILGHVTSSVTWP